MNNFERVYTEFEAGAALTDHQLAVLQAGMLIRIYQKLCEIERSNQKVEDILLDVKANRARLHVSR